MKKLLLNLADHSAFFSKLKRAYQSTKAAYYRSLPVDQNLVVFEAFRSTKYTDSPKAIYEYMLHAKEYQNYHFIWVFEEPEQYKHLESKRTKLVKHESNGHYTAFAKAKYWVINGWLPLKFEKKPGQVLLQCWHGTPLKKLRYDIDASIQTEHRENALRDNDLDAERFDYFISPSKFASGAFTSAFNLKALGKEDIILEEGYPRNDFLLTFSDSDVRRVKKQLGIPKDKKVLLYAPTWRDDQNVKGKGYEQVLPVNFDYLQQKLSDEYVLLFRAHGLVANQFDFTKYENFIYNVSEVDDVNDLYIISDVLMTDYSSVFFDYANLNRPIIFFMYDLEHYAKDLRGFYIDLKELPGDIVKKEKDVVAALLDIKEYTKKHKATYAKFNKKYNYLDDGKATERVVKKVIKR